MNATASINKPARASNPKKAQKKQQQQKAQRPTEKAPGSTINTTLPKRFSPYGGSPPAPVPAPAGAQAQQQQAVRRNPHTGLPLRNTTPYGRHSNDWLFGSVEVRRSIRRLVRRGMRHGRRGDGVSVAE